MAVANVQKIAQLRLRRCGIGFFRLLFAIGPGSDGNMQLMKCNGKTTKESKRG